MNRRGVFHIAERHDARARVETRFSSHLLVLDAERHDARARVETHEDTEDTFEQPKGMTRARGLKLSKFLNFPRQLPKGMTRARGLKRSGTTSF